MSECGGHGGVGLAVLGGLDAEVVDPGEGIVAGRQRVGIAALAEVDGQGREVDQLAQLAHANASGLELDLVYNPVGAFLPPRQSAIEAQFRRELQQRWVVAFNRLFTITNMPISRFLDFLIASGNDDSDSPISPS